MKIKYSIILFFVIWVLSFTATGEPAETDFYGTQEKFASEAIYFVLTDRFVNGDKNNDYPLQGGINSTWLLELRGSNNEKDYVGYMGGDFKGLYENADYIKNMGFTSVWITPIIDNPDEAFAGGKKALFGPNILTDGGKAGYHGYWGVNFYKEDEHLISPNMNFQEFTKKMKKNENLNIVLDIVCNHGSPAYSMPKTQPEFGKIYDENNNLVADHQNLSPDKLDALHNPLHKFYSTSLNPDTRLAELSDFNPDSEEVFNYLVNAYQKFIDKGAYAFRIDTIAFMPDSFWKKFSNKIRENHPGFFMFGENFNYDLKTISRHQKPENGEISFLDFPGQKVIRQVFENPKSSYSLLKNYMELADKVYVNPYELVTFYDNHDMARMNADENGFIDANNWLFTSRGIPCVYYGSEMRFQAGKLEHMGNRNYFGKENIRLAKKSKIYKNLVKIANLRKNSIALQKGIQVNLYFSGDKAAFLRIYETKSYSETALVLLNKGSSSEVFKIDQFNTPIGMSNITLEPHSAKVIFFYGKITNNVLIAKLKSEMAVLKRNKLYY